MRDILFKIVDLSARIYAQAINELEVNLKPFKSEVRPIHTYESRTESHEQLFFACELGTADEGECGGRWNQLLCYR